MGKGVQVILVEEGWVQEAGRGATINQRPNMYRGVVGKEEVDKKGEMARLGKGGTCGDWERATQPDPY